MANRRSLYIGEQPSWLECHRHVLYAFLLIGVLVCAILVAGGSIVLGGQ